MIYICVRTCDDEKHINKINEICYESLSLAERICDTLNKFDVQNGEKWVLMPINQYMNEYKDKLIYEEIEDE